LSRAPTRFRRRKKGTTAFKPCPDFWGPRLTSGRVDHYTNSDAVIADLKAENIDWADQVPFGGRRRQKAESS
jgi:hypothetical protein